MLTGDVNGLYAGRNQVRRALLHAASIQHCRSVRVASAEWPVTELGALPGMCCPVRGAMHSQRVSRFGWPTRPPM